MDAVQLSMIVNVHSKAMMVLIDHLSAQGLVDREVLSVAFRECATSALHECADDYPGAAVRLDVLMLNALADATFPRDHLKSIYQGSEWSRPSND